MKARLELRKRAGFRSLIDTSKLQIIKDHQLLRDGIYKHIRHPLYLGEILRNLGIAVVLSSFYGVLIIGLSSFFCSFVLKLKKKCSFQHLENIIKNTKRKQQN